MAPLRGHPNYHSQSPSFPRAGPATFHDASEHVLKHSAQYRTIPSCRLCPLWWPAPCRPVPLSAGQQRTPVGNLGGFGPADVDSIDRSTGDIDPARSWLPSLSSTLAVPLFSASEKIPPNGGRGFSSLNAEQRRNVAMNGFFCYNVRTRLLVTKTVTERQAWRRSRTKRRNVDLPTRISPSLTVRRQLYQI